MVFSDSHRLVSKKLGVRSLVEESLHGGVVVNFVLFPIELPVSEIAWISDFDSWAWFLPSSSGKLLEILQKTPWLHFFGSNFDVFLTTLDGRGRRLPTRLWWIKVIGHTLSWSLLCFGGVAFSSQSLKDLSLLLRIIHSNTYFCSSVTLLQDGASVNVCLHMSSSSVLTQLFFSDTTRHVSYIELQVFWISECTSVSFTMGDRVCSLEFYLFAQAGRPLWHLFLQVKLWRHDCHGLTAIKHTASGLSDMFFSGCQLLPWSFTLSDWILPGCSAGELWDLPWPSWLFIIILIMSQNTVEEVTVISVHLSWWFLRSVDPLSARVSSEVYKCWWPSDHAFTVLGCIAWWLICERLIVRTIAGHLTLVDLVNPLWTCSLVKYVRLIMLKSSVIVTRILSMPCSSFILVISPTLIRSSELIIIIILSWVFPFHIALISSMKLLVVTICGSCF